MDTIENAYQNHKSAGYAPAVLPFETFARKYETLTRVQAKLNQLADANRYESSEYQRLEKVEFELCGALGC